MWSVSLPKPSQQNRELDTTHVAKKRVNQLVRGSNGCGADTKSISWVDTTSHPFGCGARAYLLE
eukprot:9451907-Prorocentrum_lima.AAC.1